MTDRELLYVKTIAEERSISAAAKKLFMTQPALSHSLKSLEKEIGMPLFERSQEGMKLTYAGEEYFSMAVDILKRYEDYRQRLTDISQMRRGRVRIGMTRYISALLLPEVLPEFHSRYPNIEIELLESNSEVLETEILNRRIDFAVIHSVDETKKKISYTICCEALSCDEICIVLKKGHPFSGQAVHLPGYCHPVLDPKCLEHYPLVLETGSNRLRHTIDHILRRANVEPDVVLETALFETAKRMVKAGYGATMINDRYITEFLDMDGCEVFSIPMEYKPYWFLCVLTLADGYIPLGAQELIRMIRNREQQPKA